MILLLKYVNTTLKLKKKNFFFKFDSNELHIDRPNTFEHVFQMLENSHH